MKLVTLNKIWFLIILLFCVNQTLPAAEDIYLDMSLEELMNTDIVVTASKKREDLFEAPLDVTIIKKTDIINSGATCVPEALKLAPGVIVREMTPGNYDVQIRGFDTATSSLMIPTPNCSTILVMIDNRIVYDYFAGGTFWESLGIGITDIEKIEIVRGPASALYGPNAVNGVINIITCHNCETNWKSSGYVETGKEKNGFAELRADFKPSGNWQIAISGNFKRTLRQDSLYFSTMTDTYQNTSQLSTIMISDHDYPALDFYGIKYKDQDTALLKYAINLFSRYSFDDTDFLQFDVGVHHSKSQKAFYNNFFTPLSQYRTKGFYENLRLNYKNIDFQHTLNIGNFDNNFYWDKYKYLNYDFSLEYPLSLGNATIRPGLYHRNAGYASKLLTDVFFENDMNVPNEKKHIISNGVSCLFDYPFKNKWRFILGTRNEKYNLNDKNAFTYEAGMTYRARKEDLFRIMYSKAVRSPFMIDSYAGRATMIFMDPVYFNPDTLVAVVFTGKKDLDYLTNHTLDFGYRSKINEKTSLDLNLFFTTMENFSTMINQGVFVENVTSDGMTFPVYLNHFQMNTMKGMKVRQSGVNFTLSNSFFKKLKIKIYGQVQYSREVYTIDHYEYKDFIPESTPELIMAYSLDYQPIEKLHLFFEDIYYSKQDFELISFLIYSKTSIKPAHEINLNAVYDLSDHYSLTLACKNLQGKHRQYPFTDQIYFNIQAGCRFKF